MSALAIIITVFCVLILAAAILAVHGLVREWREDQADRLGKHFLESDRDGD